MFKLLVLVLTFFVSTLSFAGQKNMWHIKCFTKTGHTINVKAFDEGGLLYKVKAIKTKNGYLDIKALSKSGKHHVKLFEGKSKNVYVVKALKGTQKLAIKGIGTKGEVFHVKGFKDGDKYHVKCVTDKGKKFALKAISPKGVVYDVKGIKNLKGEPTLQLDIEAHIKGIPAKNM